MFDVAREAFLLGHPVNHLDDVSRTLKLKCLQKIVFILDINNAVLVELIWEPGR